MDILIEECKGSLWAAALRDGRLELLEADPPHEEVRWGNVYCAKVQSIDTSLDAAYVDLDGFNTGLLFNKDVRLENKDGSYSKGGEKAIGKVLKPGQMITVQAKTAYIAKSSDDFASPENKTARVSMDISFQGRYLVFCPMMTENRLSQRIRGKKLRDQLLGMLNDLEDIQGCILRVAAANTQTDILRREGRILKETWDAVQDHLNAPEPSLIMAGPDSVQRCLSDVAGEQIERIEIVTMDHFHHAEEWCSIFAPDLVTRIEPIELEDAAKDFALFEYRDIMGQIEATLKPYVFLKTGGNLILQETAALTAVDVNRGADKRGHLAINVEAAQELSHQLKLRNIGGIILVDFLKMKNDKDQKALLKALEDAIALDPCTVQIHGFTKLGLLEITRKRRTPSLYDRVEDLFIDSF